MKIITVEEHLLDIAKERGGYIGGYAMYDNKVRRELAEARHRIQTLEDDLESRDILIRDMHRVGSIHMKTVLEVLSKSHSQTQYIMDLMPDGTKGEQE